MTEGDSSPDLTLDQDTEAADLARRESAQGASTPGYRLLRQIGEGSFGEVWVAVQERTGQEVALKLLHAQKWLGRPRELERLRAVSAHPNIVTLLDADFEAEPPFLVMSLLSGAVDSEPTPAPDKVRSWLVQMAGALSYVHQRGLLHCDLKPSNVLLDENGGICLADFGQAAELEGGLGALGSLGYMSPEQVEAPELPAVGWDVYSLGATIYRLLSGSLPRLSPEDLAQLRQQADHRQKLADYVGRLRASELVPLRTLNPLVGPDLACIVERCLELDPEQRTPRAEQILEDLERSQDSHPLLARRPWSRFYLAGRFLKRHAAAIALLSVGLAGLLLLAGVRYQSEQRNRAILAAQSRERGVTLTADGRTQESLHWFVEALRHDPSNSSARFALEHFQPELTHFYSHGSAPDSLAFSSENSQLLSCSDSMLKVRDLKHGSILEQTAPAVQSANLSRPYSRTVARLQPEAGGFLVALSDRTLSWSNGQTTVLADKGWPLVGAGAATLVQQREEKLTWWSLGGIEMSRDGVASTAAVTPDGRVLAFVSGDILTVLSKGKEPIPLKASGEVNHLSFSPDGELLAASNYDGYVQLRKTSTGEILGRLAPGHWPIYSAHFDPAGQRLFVADYGGGVTVWSLETLERVEARLSHQWLVYGVTFSPDGRWLATYSTDGTARVWSAHSLLPATPFLEHKSAVRCVAFSPDGRLFATGSMNGEVRVFRLPEQGNSRLTHPNLAVTAARMLPGARTLVALGEVNLDGSTLSSQARNRKGLGRLVCYQNDSGQQLWSRDWESPVTALNSSDRLGFVGRQSGEVESFDPKTGNPLWHHQASETQISEIATSRDGRQLLTIAFDGTATLFESEGENFREKRRWQGEGRARTAQATHPVSATFSPDGSLVATAHGDERVQIRDASNGDQRLSLEHPSPSRRCTFGPQGERLATVSDDGTVRVWSTRSGENLHTFEHEIGVWDVQFRPDGRHLVSASGDSTCRVWDLDTGELAMAPLRHLGPAVRACYSPDGRWILSGGKDGRANLWDARSGALVSNLLNSEAPVFALDFGAEDQVVCGSGDGSLKWSNIALGKASTAEAYQRTAERKTGLKLEFLESGEALLRALTIDEWAQSSSSSSSSSSASR